MGKGENMELRDEAFNYPVGDHQLIYQGNVFDFVTDKVQLHTDESAAQRDYLAHPGAVAIAAVRPVAGADPSSRKISDWEILLVRQYRHPVRAFLWEVPAGLLDHAGEDRVSAAKRELWEEANLEAENWQVLVDSLLPRGEVVSICECLWRKGFLRPRASASKPVRKNGTCKLPGSLWLRHGMPYFLALCITPLLWLLSWQ